VACQRIVGVDTPSFDEGVYNLVLSEETKEDDSTATVHMTAYPINLTISYPTFSRLPFIRNQN
jgi:hypothetical protein